MHAFWRRRGLEVDLVVLNEHPPSYADSLQEALTQAVEASPQRGLLDQRGGVFVRADRRHAGRGPDAAADGRARRHRGRRCRACSPRLATRARGPAVATPARSPRRRRGRSRRARGRRGVPRPARRRLADAAPRRRRPTLRRGDGDDLDFYNGYGGFADDGRDYVVRQRDGDATTARRCRGSTSSPTRASASRVDRERRGLHLGARTASRTSSRPGPTTRSTRPGRRGALPPRRRRGASLVADAADPRPAPATYETRHGWGYTSWAGTSATASTPRLTPFVPRRRPGQDRPPAAHQHVGPAAPALVDRYAEWVLGDAASRPRPTSSPSATTRPGALLARNPYNPTFGDRVAFADRRPAARRELGHGATATSSSAATARRRPRPALARGGRSTARVGAGLDPCAALQRVVDARARARRARSSFLLGQADRRRGRARSSSATRDARARPAGASSEVTSVLGRRCSARSRSRRPTPELDLMLNGWLLYQTLACRLWAPHRRSTSRRRLRLPRPAPGRHGAGLRRARS